MPSKNTMPTVTADTHVIEYFYAQDCATCREALEVLRRFQSAHQEVYVLEHDVAIYVGLANRYRLASTPATVINGRRLIYGIPTLEALTAVSQAARRPANAATTGARSRAWARILACARPPLQRTSNRLSGDATMRGLVR